MKITKNYILPQLKDANILALPSKKFSDLFKKYFDLKKKILILPPVLPLDLTKVKKTLKKKDDKKYKFIIVSRLDKNKNLKLPIEAFIKLNRDDTELLIIGDGPERENIKKMIRKNNIKLILNATRREMLTSLKNSSLFNLF